MYTKNLDKCHQGFKQDKTGMDISFYQQVIKGRHNNIYRLVGLFTCIYQCVQKKGGKSETLPETL